VRGTKYFVKVLAMQCDGVHCAALICVLEKKTTVDLRATEV